MSYIDKDDGTTNLSRGEHYEVSGYVTIRIMVRYDTKEEPGEDEEDLWNAISDEICYSDFDIEDSDDLDYDIVKDDE